MFVWNQLILVGGLGAALLFAGEKTHVVEKGDTLYQISRDYKVEAAAIVRANPDKLGGGRVLKVGVKLRIPIAAGESKPPTAPVAKPQKAEEKTLPQEEGEEQVDDNDNAPAVYVVKKGDTLSQLSRQFKIAPDELRAINGLKNPALHVGQKLKVRSESRVASQDKPKSHPVTTETPKAPVATGGQSASRSPAPTPGKSRYLFIDKVKAKIDAPHVVPGRWKYLVVHHSGTSSGNARIFDYFHRNIRGMENGLAYHFVIGNGHDSGDGEIEVGDRWTRQIQGGHLHSDALNEISIGICFVGDFNSDRPTKKQIAAAIELITYLNEKCGTPPVFKAHREINPRPTECPGKNFPVKAFHELFDR